MSTDSSLCCLSDLTVSEYNNWHTIKGSCVSTDSPLCCLSDLTVSQYNNWHNITGQLCEYWQLTVLSKWSDSISSCFRVSWLKESGISDREYKYWQPQKPKCSGNAEGFTSVRLQDIFPALLMFCFGIALAALTLILELLYKRLHCVPCRHHRYPHSLVHNDKATDHRQFLSNSDYTWFTHKGLHLDHNWLYLPECKANPQKTFLPRENIFVQIHVYPLI